MNPQHRHRAQPDKPRPSRTIAHLSPAQVKLIAPLLGLLLIVIAVLSYRTATGAGGQGSDTAPAAPHHVTYKATSTGKTVIVTFTQGGDGVDGQTTAPSPWSVATTVAARTAVLTVTTGSDVRNPDRPDSVSCTIVDTATGHILVSNTVPPTSGGTVTCVASMGA